MSLRTRLIVSIALVLLASIAVGGALVYRHALSKVDTELEAAITVGGRVAFSAFHDPAVLADPRPRLELLVAGFDGDRHVQAHLVDKWGTPIISSRLLEPEHRAPDWFQRLFAHGRNRSVELPTVGIYRVILEADMSNEIGEAWSDIMLASKVLFLFFGLVLALVCWTLGGMLRPLDHLTAALARIARGDYSPRVDVEGPRELAGLCRSFNQMADRLAKAELQNQGLHEQLAAMQEEERRDLARDLHDEIGPFLFAVDVDTAAIQRMVETRSHGEIGPRVRAVREAVGHLQKHVRGLLGRLRASMVADLGLAQALETLVHFWQERHPNITFHLDIPPHGFGDTLDGTIYRIVQESMSNALRHGHPGLIEVVLAIDPADVIHLRISDDGGGLQRSRKRSGFGLLGMQERAHVLGGTLAVENRCDGLGVIVSATFPAPHSFSPRVESPVTKAAAA